LANKIIATDQVYSAQELENLKALFEGIIPADPNGLFPSASDPIIFSDFLSASADQEQSVRAALGSLDDLSVSAYLELSEENREEVTQKFYRIRTPAVTVLLSLLVQSYYRDDRVMKAIGLEARAPHPKGFEIPQGDWDLLEPVKKRGKIYRDS
jgi:hypothetical protein